MWDMKKNYKKEEEQPVYPLCEIEENTIEHGFRCGRDTDRKQRNNKNNTKEWDKVEQIYRENKEKEKKEEKKFRKKVLYFVVLYSREQ